jgi:hypothetical protein
LEKSISVGSFKIFDHQNPTETDEDKTIIVIVKEEQLHHFTMFAVTRLITPQPTVRFTPKFWH